MSRISYSQLSMYSECPLRWKLNYVDKLRVSESNIYLIFGTAMHEVCEKTALKQLKEDDQELFFMKKFLEELIALPDDLKLNENLVNSMRDQGKALIPEVFPAMEDYFEDYEVISTEEKLYEDMDDIDENF